MWEKLTCQPMYKYHFNVEIIYELKINIFLLIASIDRQIDRQIDRYLFIEDTFKITIDLKTHDTN